MSEPFSHTRQAAQAVGLLCNVFEELSDDYALASKAEEALMSASRLLAAIKRRESLDRLTEIQEEMGLYELDSPINPGSPTEELPHNRRDSTPL